MWPVALHQIVEMEHNLLLNFSVRALNSVRLGV